MSTPEAGHLSPSDITGKSFETKRRGGFDPESVQRHLAAVAATVKELQEERRTLLEEAESLRDQVAEATTSTPQRVELDEDELSERLGKDAARVLAEARAAAADRVAEAEAQADDIRAAAEEVFAERSVLADEEAKRIRESAEQHAAEGRLEAEQAAAQILARAEADAEMTRTNVNSEQQSADAEAARIIREAELTRRQILEDLARRRSAARRQIEQLRAGRERLLASHETVRRALDDISEELTISMSEARAAAETAGHSVSETTIEELEAEIETARLTGLLDTGPVPVVPPRPPKAAPVPAPEDSVAAAPETVGGGASTSDAADIEPSTSDVSAEGESPSKAGLADVVQLDLARNDVDTATHPATGRDVSTGRGNGGTSGSSGKASSTATPSGRLEAVPSPPAEDSRQERVTEVESDVDDSVGDLFASLRTTNVQPSKKATPKKSGSKKSGPKKTTANKSDAKTSKKAPEPDVDSSELTRRLKRVLADEQSRAMSTLKAGSALPDLDSLLGEEAAHGEIYWAEVLGHVDDAAPADAEMRAPVDELVSAIRRRVNAALEDADDDTESAVTSLRNIYREIKIHRVGSCADSVCRMAAGRSADRS